MVRAVCFDLDGTLFDDRQYVRAGLREAAAVVEARTGEDVHKALVTAYFGDGVQERTFDYVLEDRGLPTELVPDLVDAYHEQDADLEPYAETVRVLDELRDRYRLGLLTGGRNGDAKLERLGLDSYFDATLVAPARGMTKREVEPYRRLLDDLDVPASEAVYVGDRPALDFPHPNALGMHTVRVRRGRYADAEETEEASPTVTIDGIGELPSVLKSLD